MWAKTSLRAREKEIGDEKSYIVYEPFIEAVNDLGLERLEGEAEAGGVGEAGKQGEVLRVFEKPRS